MNKECFKCHVLKPIAEFYPHNRMKDGHLNKCKDCAKSDIKNNYRRLVKDPLWVLKERERCRIKSSIARKNGKCSKVSYATQQAWRVRNRQKSRAHNSAAKAVKKNLIVPKQECESCGATGIKLQKHHEDYSKPLDVTWLCSVCHGIRHRKPILI